MKKLMLLFFIATCISSMNYGMENTNNEINENDIDMNSIVNNMKENNQNHIPLTFENKNFSKNIKETIEIPFFPYRFNYFKITNLLISAANQYFKKSLNFRAWSFLLSNTALALLYKKQFNEFPTAKNLVKPCIFGNIQGTGLVWGCTNLKNYLTKKFFLKNSKI